MRLPEELVSETLKQNEFGISVLIFVGNQNDLRNESKTLNNLSKQGKQTITSGMGKQFARQINAVTYLECSCNEEKEIEHVFEQLFGSHFVKWKKNKIICGRFKMQQ